MHWLTNTLQIYHWFLLRRYQKSHKYQFHAFILKESSGVVPILEFSLNACFTFWVDSFARLGPFLCRCCNCGCLRKKVGPLAFDSKLLIIEKPSIPTTNLIYTSFTQIVNQYVWNSLMVFDFSSWGLIKGESVFDLLLKSCLLFVLFFREY